MNFKYRRNSIDVFGMVNYADKNNVNISLPVQTSWFINNGQIININQNSRFFNHNEEDRVVSVLRDGVLKEIEYDTFGRVIKVYQTLQGGTRTLIEQHTYDVYPSGMTGANPKGQLTTSRMAELSFCDFERQSSVRSKSRI